MTLTDETATTMKGVSDRLSVRFELIQNEPVTIDGLSALITDLYAATTAATLRLAAAIDLLEQERR